MRFYCSLSVEQEEQHQLIIIIIIIIIINNNNNLTLSSHHNAQNITEAQPAPYTPLPFSAIRATGSETDQSISI
jgi:hypothetical protein